MSVRIDPETFNRRTAMADPKLEATVENIALEESTPQCDLGADSDNICLNNDSCSRCIHWQKPE
jgi:hypothetical protein